MEEMLTLFIGTYGNKMYCYSFNTNTLEVVLKSHAKIINSSYLAISNSFEYIYALTENGNYSAVSALKNGHNLNIINRRTGVGADPCYMIYHKQHLITANYSGGSISLFPTDSDTGALLPVTQTVKFTGSGPVEKRQQSSHIHTVRVIPNTNYLLATDLGADKIWILKIEQLQNNDAISLTDNGNLKLSHNNPDNISIPAGYGPRHIAFHKNLNIFYMLGELSGKIIAYNFKEENGNLQISAFQEITADITGAQASADIHVSPSGRFLYASNRKKNDGIVIYEIQQKQDNKITGTLTQIGYIKTAKHPRNFVFTPFGNILFVASKDEQLIQIFKVDKETGMLSDTGNIIKLEEEAPVCICIAKDN